MRPGDHFPIFYTGDTKKNGLLKVHVNVGLEIIRRT